MKTGLKVAVSLTLIGIIIYKLGGMGQVWGAMVGIKLAYVIPILLVCMFDRALMTYKWAKLLNSRGLHLPFLTGMKIYCASMVWGTLLPTTVGADAIRAVATVRKGLDSNEVVASIAIERLAGFVVALFMALTGLVLLSLLGVFPPHLYYLWYFAVALIIVSLGALGASFSQSAFHLLHDRLLGRYRNGRIMQRLRQFHLTYQSYRKDKKSLAVFFLLTFAEQWLSVFLAWLVPLSLGIRVDFLFMAGAETVTILLARVPVSIDAIGVYEGIFIMMLSLAGVSPADSVAIAFVGRILQLVSWLPWWMAHAFPGKTLRPPRIDPVKSVPDIGS